MKIIDKAETILLGLLFLLLRQGFPLFLILLPCHVDVGKENNIRSNGRYNTGNCCTRCPAVRDRIFQLRMKSRCYHLPPNVTDTKYMPIGVEIMAAVKPSSLKITCLKGKSQCCYSIQEYSV